MTRMERAVRDESLEAAPATSQTSVALTQEGVGAAGRRGGLGKGALEVGIAAPRLARAVRRSGLDCPRRELGPRHEVARGGELGHVEADLGDDGVRRRPADAGDLIEARHRVEGGSVAVARSARRGLRRGEVGQELLHALGEALDLGAEGVDLLEQEREQLAVVRVEAAPQGLLEGEALGPEPAHGQLGEDLGVTLAGDDALSMARPDTPKMSLATTEILMRASSRSFSTRCL